MCFILECLEVFFWLEWWGDDGCECGGGGGRFVGCRVCFYGCLDGWMHWVYVVYAMLCSYDVLPQLLHCPHQTIATSLLPRSILTLGTPHLSPL